MIINRILRSLKHRITLLRQKPKVDIYKELYSQESLAFRAFINIGAGAFKDTHWRNLDFPTDAYHLEVDGNMDVVLDLSKEKDFPIESGTLEAAYTSHTIEHLRDSHVAKVFSEAYRILKPGGYFRITCPDIKIYFDAYKRGDRHRLLQYPVYEKYSNEQLFLREFATQLSEASNDGIPVAKKTTEEIKKTFASKSMEAALEYFSSQIDYDKWYKQVPGNHVNWWTHEKVFNFLEKAGFKQYWRSGHGQSYCPVMREVPKFDGTEYSISLYVEARK